MRPARRCIAFPRKRFRPAFPRSRHSPSQTRSPRRRLTCAARPPYDPRRRDRPPSRHRLDAARRDDGADDRGHGRHARRRLPALRGDLDLGDVRPAVGALLLGGGDRGILAGLLTRAGPQPPLALSLVGGRWRLDGDLQRRRRRGRLARPLMLVGAVVVTFLALTIVSLPIVFALGIAGFTGLVVGNFSLQKLPSSLVAGSQSWVLLAIPTFIFAGNLLERCGMSYALVDLARAMIGWVRGGLGMSVVLAEYFFSGISGSTIADVSAIGAMLTPPMLRAGYKPEHAASLVASATAMGILVPPAIFMIVLGQVTDTSVVGIFLGGFLPAAVTALCLMVVIFGQAHRLQWPKDRRATRAEFGVAVKASLVPLVVPIVIVLGFYFGVFTATEAGALLTAAVVFLLAVASVYQFLMGMLGVPAMLGSLLQPLHGTPWLFMLAVSMIVILFGMVLEGLPAAVVLVPVVFPIAKQIGIHPIHFNIVLTAAVGIGLFLPPIGVGLLMALRFANVSAGQHFKVYWPYLTALGVGLLLLIVFPEITLFLPRRAGLVR